MRAQHYTAFEAAVKSAVPALASLTFDGEVKAGQVPDGVSYLVLFDLGFDIQDDGRLASDPVDVSDGTYRVVARVIAKDRPAVRNVAAKVKALAGRVLTIPGRLCGALVAEDHNIERDDKVTPAVFWTDIDFTFRSTRA